MSALAVARSDAEGGAAIDGVELAASVDVKANARTTRRTTADRMELTKHRSARAGAQAHAWRTGLPPCIMALPSMPSRTQSLLATLVLFFAAASPACGGGTPPAQSASPAASAASSNAETGTTAAAESASPASSASPGPAASASSSAAPDATSAPPPADPTVTLTNAGRDPKATLRIHVARGVTQKTVMTMKMAMGNDATPTPLPAMKMALSLTVTDVSPDGLIRYDYKITKFDMSGGSPATGAKLGEALRGIENLSGHVALTDRGFVRESNVDVGAGAGAQLQQIVDGMKESMKGAMAPYPAEAVGIGATWDVAEVVTSKGIAIQQVAHYELVSRTGDRGKLKISVTQSANPQPLPMPGGSRGVSAMMTSLTTNGTGANDFDLTKIAPLSASNHMSTAMALDMMVNGQAMHSNMNVDLDVKVEGGK
jgi:hypothetical protein